jgi:hypothetical protein
MVSTNARIQSTICLLACCVELACILRIVLRDACIEPLNFATKKLESFPDKKTKTKFPFSQIPHHNHVKRSYMLINAELSIYRYILLNILLDILMCSLAI